MSSCMSERNNSWFQLLVLVVLLIAMNIGIKKMTDQGITGAEILFVRAMCNLVLAFVVAVITKQHIIPTQPKLQMGTFICLGFSLLLIFSAYQYISAGSVNTLQRLDIPLLSLIALANHNFLTKQFLLSLLVFVLVVILLVYNKTTGENMVGYFLVLVGVIFTVIYTLLQKKIAAKENIVAIMFVVSLSSIFWGGLRCWQAHSTFQKISFGVLLTIFELAIINLAIFYLVNELYKERSPEYVRYPYLVAAFGTMTIEMLIKGKLENLLVIIGNLAILIVLTLLVRTQRVTKVIQTQ